MAPKAAPAQCWEVVGGGDKGGLVVREGRDLKSASLPERLATGAVVKELELVGDRLQYKKLWLRDSGPAVGWVSTKLTGKDLLVKCEAPPDPRAYFSKLVPEVEFVEEESQRHLDGWTKDRGFDRIANLRDVGDSHPEGCAIPCADGKTLKRGLLFRSGHWICATGRDIARLKEEIGIMTYIDLRDGRDMEGIDAPVYDDFPPSPHKRHKDVPTPAPGKRRRLWCPFTKDLRMRAKTKDEKERTVSECDQREFNNWFFLWYNEESMTGRLTLSLASQLGMVNRAILFINSDEVLKAMKALTYRESYPVLFGCVAGKDRTGIMSCLILSALGVSEELIMEDYLRTNRSCAHINACAQVGTYLYWQELKKENPRKLDQNAKAGAVAPLDFGPAPDGVEDPFLRGAQARAQFWQELFGVDPPEETSQGSEQEQAEGVQSLDAQQAADTNAASSDENVRRAKVYRGTMDYTLQLLREQGGALAYLESIGFGADDVAKLREILTE